MPSVIATLKIKEGRLEEAIPALKELGATVLEEEAGTLAYLFHQRRDDPHTVVVYEKYESDEAFAAHAQNMASRGGAFAANLDGPPEIVVLDEL